MSTELFALAGQDLHPEYILMRDGAGGAAMDGRRVCEELWQRYSPKCRDPHFVSEFARQPLQRYTELRVYYELAVKHGLRVAPQKVGPDFVVQTPGGRAHVEVTTATVGEDRSLRDLEAGFGAFTPLEDNCIARITQALDAKRKKVDKDAERGHIGPNEPVLLVVNLVLPSVHMNCSDVPTALKALLPIAPPRFYFQEDGGVRREDPLRWNFRKQSGAPIGVGLAMNPLYEKISSFMFLRSRPWQDGASSGPFAHQVQNPLSATALPGCLKVAQHQNSFTEVDGRFRLQGPIWSKEVHPGPYSGLIPLAI